MLPHRGATLGIVLNTTLPVFTEEINTVETHIREAVQDGCDLLCKVADYVNLGGGKKLRPRLLILVANALLKPENLSPEEQIRSNDLITRTAAAVELVHVASLIHDDVVDKAAERRQRPSVNAKFGDDVAILVADLLYAHAFDLALTALDPQITRMICHTTRRMCKSEVFQIEKQNQILSAEDYYYIIESKTAALFSICSELGGVLSGATKSQRNALGEFGRLIGVAYQITDDLLNYTASSDLMGKPCGNDLEQGKQTLPLVYAYEKASEEDRTILHTQIFTERNMDIVMPLIKKYGGLDYTREQALTHTTNAKKLIAEICPDSTTTLFENFCAYIAERTF